MDSYGDMTSQELDEYVLYHIMHTVTSPRTDSWHLIIVTEKYDWGRFLVSELRELCRIMQFQMDNHVPTNTMVITNYTTSTRLKFVTRDRAYHNLQSRQSINQLIFYVDDFNTKTRDLDEIKALAHHRLNKNLTKYSIIHPNQSFPKSFNYI